MFKEIWSVASYIDAEISLRDSAGSCQRVFSQDYRDFGHASSRPLSSALPVFLRSTHILDLDRCHNPHSAAHGTSPGRREAGFATI